MTALVVRLDRVAQRLRPPACRGDGTVCEQTRLVGDGSDEPPVPELPAVCAACGRPIRWQLVVVAGVDVGLI